MELSEQNKTILNELYPKINLALYNSIDRALPKHYLFFDILIYLTELVNTIRIKHSKKSFIKKRLTRDQKHDIIISLGDKFIRASINSSYSDEFIKYSKRNLVKILNLSCQD